MNKQDDHYKEGDVADEKPAGKKPDVNDKGGNSFWFFVGLVISGITIFSLFFCIVHLSPGVDD